MKKVAIFGDSYACNWGTHAHPYWSNILQNTHGWFIHNHAYGGTGLDYSYKKFMESYDNYDIIIFVLSHPHRRTIWELVEGFPYDAWLDKTNRQRYNYLSPAMQTGMFDGFETVSRELSGQETRKTKWYERFTNSDYKNINNRYRIASSMNKVNRKYPETGYLEYHAMIDSIHARHDNVIMVPAFSYYQEESLFNVTKLDWDFYGTQKETANRYNHMSREQNIIFADLLNQRMQNDKCRKWKESLSSEHVGEYFNVSTTMHDAGLVK